MLRGRIQRHLWQTCDNTVQNQGATNCRRLELQVPNPQEELFMSRINLWSWQINNLTTGYVYYYTQVKTAYSITIFCVNQMIIVSLSARYNTCYKLIYSKLYLFQHRYKI